MNKKYAFVAVAAVFLLIFVWAAKHYSVQQESAAVEHATANQTALVRMHSPTLGPGDAPVVIVEFIDPACETCSAFYPFVKEMMANHPGKIRLVLRYAPFHQGSDKVVALLEAARRQGRLWPALESLLTSQEAWTQHHAAQIDLAWKQIEGLDLDMQRLARDMEAPEIKQLIEQDLADAKTLNVSKTPDFFVNGRPLPSFGSSQLKQLVDEALAGK